MSLLLRGIRLTLAAALLLPAAARGARPLVTEDAAILLPGYCQVETWVQHYDRGNDYWASPHCNPLGGWELIAAAGRLGGTGDGRGQWVFKAKTLLRPAGASRWSAGLVLADQLGAGDSLAGDVSVNVPVSVALIERRLLVHANLGWLRRHDGPNGVTWALAGEWNVTSRAGLTLETYGAGHDRSYLQLGARYDLVPTRVTIDVAIGNRAGFHSTQRYIAVGLTVTAQVLR
jgi:hypothetical protein